MFLFVVFFSQCAYCSNAKRSYELKLLARQKTNGQKNNEKKKTNEKKNEAAATAPFVKLVRKRKSKSAGKKGKTKKHTSGSGSSEQKTLSMKNELYVLRSANTELEKELALTRTLCHELQATTKAREDKLVQLERLVSKKDDNNSTCGVAVLRLP
jgi:hypothetical protein